MPGFNDCIFPFEFHSPSIKYISQVQGPDWDSVLSMQDGFHGNRAWNEPTPPHFCILLLHSKDKILSRRYNTADEAWEAHEYVNRQMLKGLPVDVDGYMEGLRRKEEERRQAEAAKLRVKLKETKMKGFCLSLERTDDGIYHIMYAKKFDTHLRKHDFPIADKDEALSLYLHLKKWEYELQNGEGD